MKKTFFFALAMMVAANAFAYDKQTWNYETGAKLSTGASGVHAMDIYYPETGEAPYPVFIWFGANMGNGGVSKESAYGLASVLIDTVLQRGYAVVVPNSRSQGKDGQLLPLNDSKAVIRFLRNNGEGLSEYPRDIDTSFIAVGGFDADGLIATMMGGKNWSSGGAELEGTVGNFTDKSSSVDAVASWAGFYIAAADLLNYGALFQRWLGGENSESWGWTDFTWQGITTRMSDPAPTVLFHGSADPVVKQQDTEYIYTWLQEKIGEDNSEYYLMNGQSHGLIIGSSQLYYYGYMVNFFDRIRAQKAAAATAVEEIGQDANAKHQKLLIDGQLLIERDGKLFNATGAEVQ